MKEKREAHDKAAEKRGVLGRTSRAEMPARVLEAFEEHLEKGACGSSGSGSQPDGDGHNQMPMANSVLRSVCRADGIDESALRLPSGNPALFDGKECNRRIEAVCQHVAREYADEVMETAYAKDLNASYCEEIIPSDECTATRATRLLGPLYGKAPRGVRQHISVGVKDKWEKMPGRPPYYHNAARRISQVEVPPGWDPNGPRMQSLDAVVDEKDEL